MKCVNLNDMNNIAYVFVIKYGSIINRLDHPKKKEFITYVKKLESWNKIYVSLTDGSVYKLRDYMLKLV